MPRQKFKTLTEQMFYILLCLNEECRGMDILEMVRTRTGGRVNIGSATLYDLLEMFVLEGMIRETKVEGRRRSYMLTPKGKDMLCKEYDRIMMQAQDFRNVFGKGRNNENHQEKLL